MDRITCSRLVYSQQPPLTDITNNQVAPSDQILLSPLLSDDTSNIDNSALSLREPLVVNNALPVPLQGLSPKAWQQFTNAVLKKIDSGSQFDVKKLMAKEFYEKIYLNSTSGREYTFSASTKERKAKWHAMVYKALAKPTHKPIGITHGKFLHVQREGDTPTDIQRARVFLYYYRAKSQSRLQLLVSFDAGPKLFSDIAATLDKLINEKYGGDPSGSPVHSFKVFSEDLQASSSDSAVIYLSKPLDDPSVMILVNHLEQALGDRLIPINIIGTTPMGQRGVCGTTIPNRQLQEEVLGCSTSSNGALVYLVLARAYQEALSDINSPFFVVENLNVELTQRAQFYAREIWIALGLPTG